MRIFEFDYEVDYGGGVMLIAANNEEEAREIASEIPTGFGYWVYSYERTDLFTNNENPGVILSFTHAE